MKTISILFFLTCALQAADLIDPAIVGRLFPKAAQYHLASKLAQCARRHTKDTPIITHVQSGRYFGTKKFAGLATRFGCDFVSNLSYELQASKKSWRGLPWSFMLKNSFKHTAYDVLAFALVKGAQKFGNAILYEAGVDAKQIYRNRLNDPGSSDVTKLGAAMFTAVGFACMRHLLQPSQINVDEDFLREKEEFLRRCADEPTKKFIDNVIGNSHEELKRVQAMEPKKLAQLFRQAEAFATRKRNFLNLVKKTYPENHSAFITHLDRSVIGQNPQMLEELSGDDTENELMRIFLLWQGVTGRDKAKGHIVLKH